MQYELVINSKSTEVVLALLKNKKLIELHREKDDNQFNVQIQYYIVGIDVPPQELSFALEPTR